MGQYYIAILLAPRAPGASHETIQHWLRGCLAKLMETSYLGNSFVEAVEALLTRGGSAYKSRVVWAGDYADPEEGSTKNLYKMARDEPEKQQWTEETHALTPAHRYIVNHDARTYVDKLRSTSNVHPLPLLTAEGNGRGGGDYHGRAMDMVGIWARATLSVETDVPEGFTELVVDF